MHAHQVYAPWRPCHYLRKLTLTISKCPYQICQSIIFWKHGIHVLSPQTWYASFHFLLGVRLQRHAPTPKPCREGRLNFWRVATSGDVVFFKDTFKVGQKLSLLCFSWDWSNRKLTLGAVNLGKSFWLSTGLDNSLAHKSGAFAHVELSCLAILSLRIYLLGYIWVFLLFCPHYPGFNSLIIIVIGDVLLALISLWLD
jgi:hypothetical protein